MELKALVIVQFILDLIILGILLLLGRFYLSRKAMAADFQDAMEKSMALIKEMEALGESLQAILEEKRELTNRLMEDLDVKLHKAQLIRDEIKKVTDKSIGNDAQPGRQEGKTAATRTAIEKLLAKGLSKEEVAKHLGLPTGEVELIMKLKGTVETETTGP